MLRQTAALLMAILLLASCDKDTILHSYQPLTDNCWDRRDTITFDLPEQTQDDNCSMLIGLRLTNHFPYRQLIMLVEQDLCHPAVHKSDTIFYNLANEAGDFTEGGGNYFQIETQGLHMNLKKGQTGRISIRHLMNRESLPGVTDVGIHIIR